MPATMKQVRDALMPDEPDYAKAKKLGPSALPFLKRLIKGKDPMLASKAASLAAMIGGRGGAEALEAASRSRDITVRCAAAHGAATLKPDEAERSILRLLSDRNADVVLQAVKAAAKCPRATVQKRLEAVNRSRKAQHIRAAAHGSLRALRKTIRSRPS